ncbi:XdhC family protein [Tunicatimonas pelagia]|uniref:XdhC family protein n=1 Tax=Tunicatimonas pelagia TaxID=931531 RepID=UPI0026661924|nr:XdhC family protein [Tunicatimonas pelagia]WKN45018.1 XdhC family protein [Tunicatimonas pelagia]
MREYLSTLQAWLKQTNTIALARVMKTWGSSPRPVGSVMLINSEGEMDGSVSGGCVEGDVVKQAKRVLTENQSAVLDFGVSSEEAWSVGLSCGGSIQVLLQPATFSENSVWQQLLNHTEENKAATLVSSLKNGNSTNTLINEQEQVWGDELPEEVLMAARNAYSKRSHQTITHNTTTYFIQVFPRKSVLLIIGAAHITVDLVALANQFGFETVVIDPRGYFAQHTTFSDPPAQILPNYPSEVLDQFPLDAYTFCAVLSHDPKIDDNALEILLPSEVGYIGALGSKKTHAKRVDRLLEKGIDQSLMDRIHAPIGINIHAQSAKEIALSIMSQIIEVKNQYSRREK